MGNYWQRFMNNGDRDSKRSAYRNRDKLKDILMAHSMCDAIGRRDAVQRGIDRAKAMPLKTVYYHVSRAWHIFDNLTDANIPNKITDHIQHMFDCKKQSCWSTEFYGSSFIVYSIKYARPEVYFENDAMSGYIEWPGLNHLLSTWFDPERGPYGPNPQAEAANEAWFTFSKHVKAERTLRLNLTMLREQFGNANSQEELAAIKKTIKIITIKVRTLCLKYGINFELFDY